MGISKSRAFFLALFVVSVLWYTILVTNPRPLLHRVNNALFLPSTHILSLGHPTFADIRQYERTLPQHRTPSIFKKHRSKKRYVYFSGEMWGSGWNNVFMEQLLNTHLAYLSDRGYVFVDFVAISHPPFADTLPDGTRHYLRIPMNAFTSGPTGGGSLGPGVDPKIPRAISQEWWDVVCPPRQVVEVSVAQTVEELKINDATSGEERLRLWAEKLRKMDAECVKIVAGTPFDWMFVDGAGVLSIWPSYGTSPTLKEFAWSALITRAISRNFALLSSDPYPLAAFSPLRASAPPIQGLLGIHVRRGDYDKHCHNLVDWGADYIAWNLFGRPDIVRTGRYPALPDYLTVPNGVSRGEAAYAHCWPSAREIIERIRAVRAMSESGESFPAQHLRAVYIATNGEPEWVNALAELLKVDGWDTVSSSLNMQLSKDEVAVAQAVDMSVLVSAETFIGDGFSSLSADVAQLRLAGGRHPDTIRFW
ncbi:hypothetical protein B0H11DRAFT_1820868 [Mycena galericulata]|nr:hypothetical protein B0H11DRAFT_1820868 [Mycena galericulata]